MFAGIFLQVTKSSNVSDTETIYQAKLRTYEKNDLFGSIVSIFKSFKPSLWLKEVGVNEAVVAPIPDMSSKATFYLASLQQL